MIDTMEGITVNRKQIFIAMFRAMDCLYDENPSESLGEFLSEANPYLFKDRESADPALILEFYEYMKAYGSAEDETAENAYRIVAGYLKSKGFEKRFADISIDEWKNLCRIIEDEEGVCTPCKR